MNDNANMHANGRSRAHAADMHANGRSRSHAANMHANGRSQTHAADMHANGRSQAHTANMNANGCSRNGRHPPGEHSKTHPNYTPSPPGKHPKTLNGLWDDTPRYLKRSTKTPLGKTSRPTWRAPHDLIGKPPKAFSRNPRGTHV